MTINTYKKRNIWLRFYVLCCIKTLKMQEKNCFFCIIQILLPYLSPRCVHLVYFMAAIRCRYGIYNTHNHNNITPFTLLQTLTYNIIHKNSIQKPYYGHLGYENMKSSNMKRFGLIEIDFEMRHFKFINVINL